MQTLENSLSVCSDAQNVHPDENASCQIESMYKRKITKYVQLNSYEQLKTCNK